MKKKMLQLLMSLLFISGIFSYPSAFASIPTDGKINSLLKNIQHTSEDLSPRNLCSPELQSEGLKMVAQPWPSEFATFISHELAKFDLLKEIAPFLDGIYIADFYQQNANIRDEELEDIDKETFSLYCFDQQTKHFAFVINSTLLEDRQHIDHLDNPSKINIETGAIDESGDLALRTIFLNLFYIYNDVNFSDYSALSSHSFIHNFMDYSWRNLSSPKLGLPPTPSADNGLAVAKKQAIVLLSALRHNNFLSLDAAKNPRADLAESMVTYYMGTRYHQWQRLGFYEGKRKNYIWDVHKFLTGLPVQLKPSPHLMKLQLIGQQIFAEDFLNRIWLTL